MHNLDEIALQLYEKLKNEKRITQVLVMRHAGVDFETADKICHKIWRRMREEAKIYVEEIYSK